MAWKSLLGRAKRRQNANIQEMAILSPRGRDVPTTIGTELQRLRLARGLSLNRLAQQAGVSTSSLSRWEAQKRLPSIPELELVLSALEVSEAQKASLLRLIHAPRALQRLRALETTTSEAYNGRGALLWAMRQRKGWTQADTARAVGVTQVQITRWEQGDAWPSTENLHTLCWCLSAQPEEAAALMRPGGSTGNLLFGEDSALHQDRFWWTDYVKDLLLYPPPEELLSLTFIGVQQQLSRLVPHRDFAVAVLADVYAIHARHCLSRKQTRMAAHWAERGLALVRRQSFFDRPPVWFGNVLVLAAAGAQNKRPAGLRRAGNLLRNWLPALERGRENAKGVTALSAAAHHAWGQMMLAGYLNQLGQTHAALEQGRSACEEGEQLTPSEGYMRLRDFAEILCEANQPERALEALAHAEKLLPLSEVQQGTKAQHHLLEACCLCVLGDRKSASERAYMVEQLITQHELWYLQDNWRRVTADL